MEKQYEALLDGHILYARTVSQCCVPYLNFFTKVAA